MIQVYCISHKRPSNVEKIHALCGPVTWVVGQGEANDYFAAGAQKVIEGGGLCESRNAALEDAFRAGQICIQISDDLRRLWWILDKKNKCALPFAEAIKEMEKAVVDFRAKLIGVAPTANAYFFNKEHHFNQFIVGDMIAVAPCDLRFDTNLKLKEDYDFTAQHLQKFGLVVRLNRIAPEFLHRTNPGGAVDFRTAEREQHAIAYLKNKWPGWFRDNHRRPNEILMTFR